MSTEAEKPWEEMTNEERATYVALSLLARGEDAYVCVYEHTIRGLGKFTIVEYNEVTRRLRGESLKK